MVKEVFFYKVDAYSGSSTLCVMEFYELLEAFHFFNSMGGQEWVQATFLIHPSGLDHEEMMCLLDDDFLDFVWVYNP